VHKTRSLLAALIVAQLVWLGTAREAEAEEGGGNNPVCATCLTDGFFYTTHYFLNDCCDPGLGAENCYKGNLHHTEASGGPCGGGNHHYCQVN
jgi:hypothetical protein